MKIFKFLTWASVAMLLGMSVVSCGDDDDNDIKDPTENNSGNGGNGGNDNPGTEIPESSPSVFGGMLLTSVIDNNNYGSKFYYDSNCFISSIDDDGDIMTVDYNNGTVSLTEGDYSETVRITTTKNGLITSISGSGDEYDDGVDIKYSLRWDFTYDADDHLTKVTYEDISRNSAGEEVGSEVNLFIFQWIDGMLATMSMEGSEIYGGSSYTWGKDVVFSYITDYSNTYKQYTSSLIDAIDLDSSIDPCMYVGCFGKGPVKLPSHIKETWTEGDDYESYDDTDITYTFNSNGLVATENTSSTSYGETYTATETYNYSDSPVAAKAMTAQAKSGTKHKSLRKGRHSRRHSALRMAK